MELYRSSGRSLRHSTQTTAALQRMVIHPSFGDIAWPLLFGLTSRVAHKFISRWNWWMSRPLCPERPSLASAHKTLHFMQCQPTTSFVHKYQLDRFKGHRTRDKVLLKHSMVERGEARNGKFYWLSLSAGGGNGPTTNCSFRVLSGNGGTQSIRDGSLVLGSAIAHDRWMRSMGHSGSTFRHFAEVTRVGLRFSSFYMDYVYINGCSRDGDKSELSKINHIVSVIVNQKRRGRHRYKERI